MEQKMTNNHITIGILAHVDAGKTTLSEAMLYSTADSLTRARGPSGRIFGQRCAGARAWNNHFSKQARLDISCGTNAQIQHVQQM